MNVIYFLLPVALGLGSFFVVWFIWSVKGGQYDDLNTPAYRMLIEDEIVEEKVGKKTEL
ncbi:MAG: cbb3-type cytochrome oxidase assembly protein CcoS [SAR324 cluster bacterium]|nr:cbb3-type cytochrome oxidase assembly protein CcoS [SAR324 cluster bacterium]